MINPIDSYTTQSSNLVIAKATTKANIISTAAANIDVAMTEDTNSNNTPVTLSEKSLLLSRISDIQETNEKASVTSAESNVTLNRIGQNTLRFLTEKDLSLVSDMYVDSKKQGTDPVFVDSLATTLGQYRESDNGKRMTGFNEGMFDSEGHQLSSSYSHIVIHNSLFS